MKRIILSVRGINRLLRDFQTPLNHESNLTFYFGKVEGRYRYALARQNPEGGRPIVGETGILAGPEN